MNAQLYQSYLPFHAHHVDFHLVHKSTHDRDTQIHEYFHSFLDILLNLYDGIHSITHLHHYFYHELLLRTRNRNRIRKNLQHWGFGLYARPKSNCGSNNARYPSYIKSQTYKIGEGDHGTLCNLNYRILFPKCRIYL